MSSINIIETLGLTFDFGQEHPSNKFSNLFLQFSSFQYLGHQTLS